MLFRSLRRQFELEIGIVEAMNQSYDALQQVRNLREQLRSVKGRVRQGQMQQEVDTLERRLSDLDGTEGGWGALFLSTPEGRSLTRLNVGLKTLLAAVDSADTAPTKAESDTFRDAQTAVKEQLALWNEIKTKDVPALNSQLQKSGLPALDLSIR